MSDPTSLDPGMLTTINIVVVVAFQIWSRLNGNKKMEAKGEEVKKSTAAQTSVDDVKAATVRLEADMKKVKLAVGIEDTAPIDHRKPV